MFIEESHRLKKQKNYNKKKCESKMSFSKRNNSVLKIPLDSYKCCNRQVHYLFKGVNHSIFDIDSDA